MVNSIKVYQWNHVCILACIEISIHDNTHQYVSSLLAWIILYIVVCMGFVYLTISSNKKKQNVKDCVHSSIAVRQLSPSARLGFWLSLLHWSTVSVCVGVCQCVSVCVCFCVCSYIKVSQGCAYRQPLLKFFFVGSSSEYNGKLVVLGIFPLLLVPSTGRPPTSSWPSQSKVLS